MNKNTTGIIESIQGRKPRVSVAVDNYVNKHVTIVNGEITGNRLHKADIEASIARLQSLLPSALVPTPVVPKPPKAPKAPKAAKTPAVAGVSGAIPVATLPVVENGIATAVAEVVAAPAVTAAPAIAEVIAAPAAPTVAESAPATA